MSIRLRDTIWTPSLHMHMSGRFWTAEFGTVYCLEMNPGCVVAAISLKEGYCKDDDHTRIVNSSSMTYCSSDSICKHHASYPSICVSDSMYRRPNKWHFCKRIVIDLQRMWLMKTLVVDATFKRKDWMPSLDNVQCTHPAWLCTSTTL